MSLIERGSNTAEACIFALRQIATYSPSHHQLADDMEAALHSSGIKPIEEEDVAGEVSEAENTSLLAFLGTSIMA